MLHHSTPPLPTLPLEIQHEVLRFCDPSSLGRASQVSLAFLQLSSPLLYRDVSVRGMEDLEKFFCTRVNAQNPRFPSSLSYLKTFSFTETRLSIHPPPALLLGQNQIDLAPILQVDELSIFVPFVPQSLHLPPRHQLVQRLLASYLLPRFAPIKIRVEGVASPQDVEVQNTPSLCFDRGCWTNLTSISFKDATTSSPLRDQPLNKVVLVPEFSEDLPFEARWFMVNSTLDELFGSGTAEEGSMEVFPGGGIERVEIWVDSEERKEELAGIFRKEALACVDASFVEGRLRRIKINARISRL